MAQPPAPTHLFRALAVDGPSIGVHAAVGAPRPLATVAVSWTVSTHALNRDRR